MDIRRTILWLIFSFSLLLLWNNWQTYTGQPSLFPGFTAEASKSEETSSKKTDNDTSIPENIAQKPSTATQPEFSETVPAKQTPEPSPSEKVVVETDVYKLTFDTLGAQLVKAELKKFTGSDNKQNVMVLLDDSEQQVYLAQTGVVGAPEGKSYPTHLTPFRLLKLDQSETQTTVAFEAESDGVKVVKTFALAPQQYDIKVSHEIFNEGNETITPSVYLQLTRDGNDPPDSNFFYRTFVGPAVYSSEDKYQKVKFSDINKDKASYIKESNNGWIAFVQHYFASAWIPTEGATRYNQIAHADNLYFIRAIEPIGSINAGESRQIHSQLWVGPQDQKAMQEIAPGLDVVVDYGFLTIIAKPLFQLMTWLHSFVGNWGWTIVVLTLLIKLVFYPLSAASYRSMAKMKQVAPRLKLLREQYGDDRAKLNTAMMDMYRTEKINPLGGCLPMVVQIPVFISLYWVLLGSVEMRGAPWILWIHDLAATDPYFILPAIMMATMFLQIKLNPTPPDPMQARVMMIMPLVFGGMMFFFPAGLVLYWCVNNIISIAQQRYIMHKLDKETAEANK